MLGERLKIEVLPIQFVERRVAKGGISAVLSVLGPNETREDDPMFHYPKLEIRHDRVLVSDVHYAALWSKSDVAAARSDGLIEVAESHIRQILDFGAEMIDISQQQDDPISVIVHCHLGHSRSPAAALLILALIDGPGVEQKTVRRIFEMVPGCHPNPMFVRLGDRLLQRNGALEAAVTQELKLDQARLAAGPRKLILF